MAVLFLFFCIAFDKLRVCESLVFASEVNLRESHGSKYSVSCLPTFFYNQNSMTVTETKMSIHGGGGTNATGRRKGRYTNKR